MPVLMVKPILPDLIKEASVRGAIMSALNQTAKLVKADLDAVTATWNDKPQFFIQTSYKGGNVTLAVYAIHKVFNWLDKGTSVRYVTMTPDFQPKTTPGWIGSRQGAGGVARFDMLDPKPGIQAREWTKVISHERQKDLADNVAYAIRNSMLKATRKQKK